jgi:hypothetical protein
MSRAQLCGRIHAARLSLDLLQSQAQADGDAPFRAYGTLKVELIRLEAELRTMDNGAPVPMWPHDVHTTPAAEERLRTAGADLAELLHAIAVDGELATTNGRET